MPDLSLLRRVRWGNVALAGAVVAVGALLVFWPRLRAATPALPPAAPRPVGVVRASPASPPEFGVESAARRRAPAKAAPAKTAPAPSRPAHKPHRRRARHRHRRHHPKPTAPPSPPAVPVSAPPAPAPAARRPPASVGSEFGRPHRRGEFG
jgi:hypothetical protein